MSDLTKEQIAILRDLLLQKQKETEETLSQLKDASQKVSLDEPIGRLSRMDALAGQQMAIANKSNLQNTLSKIKNALSKLDDEMFGHCIECEVPIAWKRLELYPESTHCMQCSK